MRCSQLIIQDHIILRRGLNVVDGMLQKLECGQRIEIFDATVMLKFLRLFGDQYHQAMEETVLFPALLAAAPDECPLHQFVSEHGDERTLVAEIEEALTSRKGMAFFRSSRRLTGLLRAHCDREEMILGELAERFLSIEHDEALGAEFLKKRSQVEPYIEFSRLERRYTGPAITQPSSQAAGLARVRIGF
jgi:hemerythrin-like domain-containing protein